MEILEEIYVRLNRVDVDSGERLETWPELD